MFRHLISKLIPNYCSATSGWIVNHDGAMSEERDIIIYDKNKAPNFFFDIGIGLVPAISILYDIQIKTTISPKNIKTALEKFKFSGYRNALISLKGTHLLEKYLKVEPEAIRTPKITILSSEDDRYYWFDTQEVLFQNVFSEENLKKELKESAKIDLIGSLDNVTINGIKYKDIIAKKFFIKRWYAVNLKKHKKYNITGFFMGLLNTLYGNNISSYLTDEVKEPKIECLTCVVIDHKNNIVFTKKNLKGLNLNLNYKLSIKETGEIELIIQSLKK